MYRVRKLSATPRPTHSWCRPPKSRSEIPDKPAMKVPVLLLSIILAVSAEQKCYGDLGCYQTSPHFQILPQAPDVIKTQFLLYSRHSRTHATTMPATDKTTWSSKLTSGHFSASKPTKVITHGFLNNGNTKWVHTMRDALLTKGDFNVIVVDWGHGSGIPYFQATANTFLVAAEVARFLKTLHQSHHLDLSTVHLIGHSLGAQISGNVGSALRGIGRISGLDPAEPYFINFQDSQRLDKTDATFVDIIHTDGEAFTGIAGYGMMKAMGHIDFYPNGGQDQPGCTDDPLGGILGGILGGHTGQIGHAVSCSHSRAIELFTESIHPTSCHFTAHVCRSWATYETGTCHGCPSGGCPMMGYDADKTSARGSFYLSTVEKSPYCGREFFVEVDLAPVKENVYGRLYVTIMGSKRTSANVEFSRDDRHYHQSETEKHVIAVHGDVGSVTGVKVKFERGKGLSAAGTDQEIVINKVLVRDANTSHQVKFCSHNAHIQTDHTVTMTSHSGC